MDLLTGKRQRIVALDIMRGYFLIMIIINHLYFFPSIYELLTGRGELWVSAAEGFFLISGMLVGYIYTKKMRDDPKATIKRIYRRVLLLYFWAIMLTTIALAWAHFAGDRPLKSGVWWYPEPLEYLWKVGTLQYNYGWSDFLQYYVLFMLISPVAVWLCTKKKAWLVLVLSFAVWCLRGNNFNMAWQLLFMVGIVLGYYLPRIEQWYSSRSRAGKRRIALVILIPTAITLLASIAVMHGPRLLDLIGSGDGLTWLDSLRSSLLSWQATSLPRTDKWSLAPARLVLIALWFSALYLLVRTNERRIDRWTAKIPRTIGEVSLGVYGVHALVILGIHMYLGTNGYGFIGNTIFTTVLLAGFYAGARWRRPIKAWLVGGFTRLKQSFILKH